MSLRPLLGIAFVAAGCVAEEPAQTTFPSQQWQQWQAQPQQVSGPPGGAIDPGYGYQYQNPELPDQPGYPQGYSGDSVPPSTEEQAADQTLGNPNELEPSENPQDPGYVMGNVTDEEIDSTLDQYGSWEESDEYGRVWRPNTTVVGVDFTPYETCGSWIWSDWGWNYSCDWSWGWLPFHYGRWGWFDDYWGWVPGYEWTPGAVEWRGGGGYTGWRPLTPQIRDHRGEHNPPTFHDHRYPHTNVIATAHDSHWRFTADNAFGHGHIHGKLLGSPAEGLRVTSPVGRPSFKGNYAAVSSASLMRGRLAARATAGGSGSFRPRPGYGSPNQGFRQQPGWSRANETPTWRPRPAQGWQQPSQSWQRPQPQWNNSRPQPQWNNSRPQPQWGGSRPAPSWNNSRPSPSWGGSRPAPSWNNSRPAPSWGGSRPSPSWGGSRPSPSWGGSRPSAPSGGWSAPSHSSGGGGGYHSSGSSSSSHSSGGGGGGHSSGGGGGHSGGGGHHR